MSRHRRSYSGRNSPETILDVSLRPHELNYGNGVPLGAVVTTPEIAEVLTRRSYFNTFGGNLVCTAAGLAVLRVVDRENLQENAHVVGSYLKDRLNSLKAKHEIIGDVRGRGLMLGVELVTDRQLKTPAKIEILQVMDQMKDMGVLIGKGGFHGNVFKITPPLCFSRDDADAHHTIIDDSEIIVDYNRQHLMPGWIPRRLGGALGGKKESGQLRFGGRERPFRAPLYVHLSLFTSKIRLVSSYLGGEGKNNGVA